MSRSPDPTTHFGEARKRRQFGSLNLEAFIARGKADAVPEHVHEKPHFVFVAAGLYRYSSGREPCILTEPAVIFNPAWTAHRDQFISVGHFCSLTVTPEWIQESAEDAMPINVVHARQTPPVITAARRLAAAALDPSSSQLDAESAAAELLAYFLEGSVSESRPLWLDEACAMLQNEGEVGHWSTMRVAAQLGVSAVHLARVFRKHLRCSPGEYVHALRIRAASNLLSSTDRPLAEIAVDAGYSDQSHFTRCFRKRCGVTPGHYRSVFQA